ncbi:aminotransferase [Egibacter rhizosphaerae]|uniref:Aminotransferase n=1 Tax=Egibacter rhizosphaerae TaxID=1670831 RepID=A0A411YFE9_9ACTN|nr:aminotransferase [Egibacter rhizosphaerae]QBI19842.1 aminotransferase [Egibacter rhizosphaerae]
MSYKAHFGQALEAAPGRLHFAAHSHHPWPDVTREAQLAAWDLAARHLDGKWELLFDRVVPEAAGHVARRLALPDPATVAFAPNTHEFLLRILSCVPPGVSRVLTSDAEFHTAERQLRRLEEAGAATVTRVAAEPFDSFPDRFVDAARAGAHDLVLVSHVFFSSGYVVPDLPGLVAALPEDPLVLLDGYHGFMAVPTDLSGIADRAFYTAGAYKYAMAGEGACFLHCPPGWGPRPRDTGWFAAFGARDEGAADRVAYPDDGRRFLGATFDPTGILRFNAAQRWVDEMGLDVAAIHAHVGGLQQQALDMLSAGAVGAVDLDGLVPPPWVPDRGHFLTFETPEAGALQARLAERDVVTDRRGDRIRFGFGIYHDPADIDALFDRLTEVAGA